ncbi:hypothetical protein AB0J27_33965 [Micromonospora chokoriensis]
MVSKPETVPTIVGAGLPALGVGPDFDYFALLRTESTRRDWKPETEVLSADPAVAAEQERERQIMGSGSGSGSGSRRPRLERRLPTRCLSPSVGASSWSCSNRPDSSVH